MTVRAATKLPQARITTSSRLTIQLVKNDAITKWRVSRHGLVQTIAAGSLLVAEMESQSTVSHETMYDARVLLKTSSNGCSLVDDGVYKVLDRRKAM